MRPYFQTIVDQLDLAASQLSLGDAIHARLALILCDNAVELMLHQQCVQAAQRDRMYGHLPYRDKLPHLQNARLEPRVRAEITGKSFAAKLSFCRQRLHQITDDEFEVVRIGHEVRNELYHVGTLHEEVIYALAWHYHDLACELFGRLPLDTCYWQTDDALSEAVVRHTTTQPWKLSNAFLSAAQSLAGAKPHSGPALENVLSDWLQSRLDIIEQYFGWIGSGSRALIDAEFDDYVYGEDSPVWHRVRDVHDEQARQALVSKIWAEWSPQYGANRIPGWRQRCVSLSSVHRRGDAMSRFAQLESGIEPFERFVTNAANAVINAIETEVEIRRGK